MPDTRTASAPPVILRVGTIIDVVGQLRTYLVRITGWKDIYCAAMSPSGSRAIGPARFGLYEAGEVVLVYVGVTTIPSTENGGAYTYMPASWGLIIGTVPSALNDSASRVTDSITQVSKENTLSALQHVGFLGQHAVASAGLDVNPGLPLDAMPDSDDGIINELGVGFGVSRFLSWIRASETAGLTCFYLDNLVRLAAQNYEFWHAGGERSIKNDEGEVSDVEIFSSYPWEAMGVALPAKLAAAQTTDGGSPNKPGQLWYEPVQQDQQGIARMVKLRGYLGDMQRLQVVKAGTVADVMRYADRNIYTGLLDVHYGIDGAHVVRSARSIISEKYCYIPVPKQLAPPEQTDATGDGITNYAPAGRTASTAGNIPTAVHAKNDFRWSSETSATNFSVELYDYLAYSLNWYGVKPLVAHTKDWYLPDEGVGDLAGGVGGVFKPAAALDSIYSFPLPQFGELEIDHRNPNKTRYYRSRSIMAQLPDGSIVIEDGYGSSITMAGGNMTLTCAGDVMLRPGRSLHTWAGDDIVMRAGSSVDVTAARADVRIKAERNLHALAGNDTTTGGIILESRSVHGVGGEFDIEGKVGEDVKTYGIVLKTAEAPCMIYGRDVYVQALPPSGGGGSVIGGTVTLNAGKQIVTSSYDEAMHYSKAGFVDIIGQELKDGTALSPASTVNRYSHDTVLLGATGSGSVVRIKAATTIVDAADGMLVAGIIATAKGVAPIPSSQVTATIETRAAPITTWVDDTMPALLEDCYKDAYVYGIKADTVFITNIGFSCRNGEQYGSTAEGFKIPEARWQQMYREAGKGVVLHESVVMTPDGATETMPHPGYNEWQNSAYYQAGNLKLWSWSTGASVARGEQDDDGASEYDKLAADDRATAIEEQTLRLKYLISKQFSS